MNPAFPLTVTTSLRATARVAVLARDLAHELNAAYVPRDDINLAQLAGKGREAGVVVVSAEKITLVIDGEEFFYHPGMAKLRIKDIKAGKTDQMVKAMVLEPACSVLDCTLGFAADAVVASFVTGEAGRVVGVESVPVVASIVRFGLHNYRDPRDEPGMFEAMRRIEVRNDDHRDFLRTIDDDSFDVVYFDPMFRNPLYSSVAMGPLRRVADDRPLQPDDVAEALRVARKRVVIKERRDSGEFRRLGCSRVVGGRHSPVAYGVISKEV